MGRLWSDLGPIKMGQVIHFNNEKIPINDKDFHARGSVWHRSTVRLDGPARCGKIRLGRQWCWLQCHNLVSIKSNWDWVERIFIWYCSGTVAKTEATNLTGAMRHSQQHWPSSVWLVFEPFERYKCSRNHNQADGTWSRSRLPKCTCKKLLEMWCVSLTLPVTHCLNPPTPPSANNLTLEDWDSSSSMSDWNAKINYTCNAGGHNAFVSNRWKDFYELTCQEDNNFSTPTWPTCVSSRSKQKIGV